LQSGSQDVFIPITAQAQGEAAYVTAGCSTFIPPLLFGGFLSSAFASIHTLLLRTPGALSLVMLSLVKVAIASLCFLPLISAEILQLKRENLFEANLRKRINPHDELLKRALWAASRNSPYDTYSLGHDLRKRASFSPLYGLPTCLKCAGKRKNDASLVYDDFTAAKFVNKIILGGRSGACLFYGQRPPNTTPRSYSDTAVAMACHMSGDPNLGAVGRVRSIWVRCLSAIKVDCWPAMVLD
jgi:hypothetical protein